MQQLFLTVLNITVRASVLICCVLLIRKIASGRCNRAISLLWTLVAIRLLLPFSIAVPGLPTYDSHMTVWASSTEQSNPGIVTEIQKKVTPQTTVQPTESEGQDDSAGMAGTGNTAVNPTKEGNFHDFLMMTLSVIWIAGITLFAGYNLYTLIRLRRTLTESIPTECVMRCDGIAVPFVFGLIHPRIYVPSDLAEKDIQTVIAHEKVHIRRGDHIAKVVFTFVTVVHWFNPLVWLAFWLFDRDLEMSCDDSVTEKMTEEERTDYLNTVLSCSRKRVAASGFLPGFADGSLRERIINIKRTKKNRRLAVLLSLLTGIVLFGCSFATRKKPAEEQNGKILGTNRFVCGMDYVAELRADGTVEVTALPGMTGNSEIDFDEVKGWKDIVSLRAESGVLFGIDSEGRLHYSSFNVKYLESVLEIGEEPETVPQSQLMHAIPKLKELAGKDKLSDCNLFDTPQVLLTKDGTLTAFDLTYPADDPVIVSVKNVTLFDGNLYLKKGGTIGTIAEKEANQKGFEKLKGESGFCGIAENQVSVFGLRNDGTVVAGSYLYAGVVDSWKNVSVICAALDYIVALHSDGHVSAAASSGQQNEWIETIQQWKDIVEINVNGTLIVGRTSKGEIKTVRRNQAEIDADAEKKQREADEKRLEELKLDPLASYYMNTSPEKGLTVCVWKMKFGYEKGEGQILCGLLPRQLDKIYEPKGTYDPGNYYDPEYTYDMGRMGLGLGGFSPEDMKIILSTFDLPKEKISVIGWHNPADNIGACARPTTTEVREVKDYLLGDRQ